MPEHDLEFLKTQIGRSVEVHFEPPEGTRRKAVVKPGLFIRIQDGRMLVALAGDEHPILLERDANQPAFATRDRDGSSVWWKWTSPQRPLAPDFKP